LVIGLGIYTWEDMVGAVLDIKYPETLEISERLANKVLMAHSIAQDDRKEDFLELELEGQIVLSYWRYMDEHRGYELALLLMSTEERARQQYFKTKFLKFAMEVLSRPKGDKRSKFFFDNVNQFFIESHLGKLVILGREASGKSSIKSVIFEGKDPRELLTTPLKATPVLTPSVYSWLDLELGVFDTAGQRIREYLEEGKKQSQTFAKADIVIYLFDFPRWNEDNEVIFRDITSIANVIEENKEKSEIVLFCHKIDLIEDAILEEKIEEIKSKLSKQFDYTIYFTSICPDFLYDLYSTIYEILGKLSKESAMLKEVMDEKIHDLSNTMFFITNEHNNIVAQTMTPDFDISLINYMHNLVANINDLFEEIDADNKIKNFMLTTVNDFNVIMQHLELPGYELKNIVSISGDLTTNKLIWEVGEVTRAIIKKLRSYR